ncbi:MAG: hypothetical protein J3Q66DRAFT_373647 [Benniella sp.]|nr:MAG: hypothetical protein J3Q66DRAFT_373647 [Benniella sp.]
MDYSLIMASIDLDLMVASREKEPSRDQTVGGMDCPGFLSTDNGCSHRHALTPTVRQRRTSLDFQAIWSIDNMVNSSGVIDQDKSVGGASTVHSPPGVSSTVLEQSIIEFLIPDPFFAQLHSCEEAMGASPMKAMSLEPTYHG